MKLLTSLWTEVVSPLADAVGHTVTTTPWIAGILTAMALAAAVSVTRELNR